MHQELKDENQLQWLLLVEMIKDEFSFNQESSLEIVPLKVTETLAISEAVMESIQELSNVIFESDS